ncbi:MAG: DUF1552 domain-containing protein [Myxococcota bacterium]|nr:DUF1552 domain-containing protein [Myxococcota bacterium]
MIFLNRRRALKNLLAGSSSVLLAPLVTRVVAEACGAQAPPKRVVFVVEGCGMNYTRFTPPGIALNGAVETDQFELSPMMSALSRHRDRLTLIDGLSNDQGLAGSGHSTAYAALSCVPNDPPSEVGRPGGETLDQYLGRTMGACSIFPTLGLGVGNTPSARIAPISANQARRPVPIFCRPQDAFQQLFSPAFLGANADQVSRGALFDILRADVNRLRSKLAADERRKLDEILSAVEALERRDEAIRDDSEFLQSCAPQVDAFQIDIEGALAQHVTLATSALICGLTKVITIASGCGYGFFDVPFTGLGLNGSKHQFGHGYEGGLDSLDQVHNYHADLIAQMCDRLALTPEGNGSMLDNTLIVWTNENGGLHHSDYQRWPVVLIGGGAMGVRHGRYLRFPEKGTVGARSLADLWSTLCHLLDAPRDDFGQGGRELIEGPINAVST